jgi:hypothetical protein
LCSSFLYHDFPEQGIDSGLIAFTLLAEPSKHIRIEAKSYLLLDGSVEWVPHGIAPKVVGQFWDVRQVDFALGSGSEPHQFLLPSGGGLALSKRFSDDFVHNGFAPFGLLGELK